MKVLFCLTRTLGDIVLGNTLVDNIKEQNPDYDITWHISAPYQDLIKYNPNVTAKIISGFDEVYFQMRSYEKIVWPAQSNHTDTIWHQREETRHQHLIDFYASRCNIKLKDRKLKVYTKPEVNIECKEDIGIHNFSNNNPDKSWNKMQTLIDNLVEKGLKIAQLGAPGDPLLKNVVDRRDKYTLDVLPIYLQQLKLFIGIDSGLSYLAAASGTKTIALHGPTVFTTSGAYGDNVIQILSNTKEECKDKRCHTRCRFGEGVSCIDNITLEEVTTKVNECLKDV